ncbi:hypothetical protein Zmor_004146 [Zophobas morio]|uniref:Ribosome biogenesis regulatory protein n=1 Tax=Zophobas morio TaxID=2755281 RepID=A0AA38HJG8_9CUCU|nr:hypothetical protein Zmor_004146 [Zophobas morio]
MVALLTGSVLNTSTSKYIPTEVHKELKFDLGNLAVFDDSHIDEDNLKTDNRELYLKELNKENVQALINSIWGLPTIRKDEVLLAQLPEPITPVPREKPVPEKRPPTKWERFAQLKGIKKRKKSRLVFDDVTGTYKPRWGHQRANDQSKDWLIELPKQADPYMDAFGEIKENKKGRILKNKKQQNNNNTNTIDVRPQALKKKALEREIVLTKKSTASLGRFDQKLKEEPKIKQAHAKKNKFASNIEPKKARGKEQSINKAILKKVIASIYRPIVKHIITSPFRCSAGALSLLITKVELV